MWDNLIVLNGTLLEEEKVILDSGFYFGRGLFETMLVKEKPIFLNEHLDRINKGLKLIGVNKTISDEEVMKAVLKLKCKNNILKLVVTEKNTIFTSRKNNYIDKHYKKGFSIKISNVKRNEYSSLTYLKSMNYLENILEHEKCISEGYNEVLFLNTKGNLAEGSISNVFFVKNGKIHTPKVECGLLSGTIRKCIVDKYNVVEGEFIKEDLLNSEGIFLTNSIMGIMKVSEACGIKFKDNNIIENIYKDYNNYINLLE